ncbi:YjjG family noncanonical pyrimidine nucleotidase [Arcticibacter sp. MXS-1]|uniref:YjjG family noncanonical pyrimidine nucleotidase n=1 Tax=Arcticibacter sp. MXS-1 TaxID=3341726 RepID=UPI0035A8A2CF
MERKSEMKYKHIFFDLDHTLWDFDKNAEETLHELYQTHQLEALGVACPHTFIKVYTENNHQLWASYHLGAISKTELRETRFKKTFLDMGLSAEVIPPGFENDYVRICPTKTNLFPGVHEVLAYLKSKYTLHLISNGFLEATTSKVDQCELRQYFQSIIISELVGVNKPDPAIFSFALEGSGASKEESVMVGDSIEADIRGAIRFGIDAIYFNPARKPVPPDVPAQINSLEELTMLL